MAGLFTVLKDKTHLPVSTKRWCIHKTGTVMLAFYKPPEKCTQGLGNFKSENSLQLPGKEAPVTLFARANMLHQDFSHHSRNFLPPSMNDFGVYFIFCWLLHRLCINLLTFCSFIWTFNMKYSAG